MGKTRLSKRMTLLRRSRCPHLSVTRCVVGWWRRVHGLRLPPELPWSVVACMVAARVERSHRQVFDFIGVETGGEADTSEGAEDSTGIGLASLLDLGSLGELDEVTPASAAHIKPCTSNTTTSPRVISEQEAYQEPEPVAPPAQTKFATAPRDVVLIEEEEEVVVVPTEAHSRRAGLVQELHLEVEEDTASATPPFDRTSQTQRHSTDPSARPRRGANKNKRRRNKRHRRRRHRKKRDKWVASLDMSRVRGRKYVLDFSHDMTVQERVPTKPECVWVVSVRWVAVEVGC